MITRFLLAIYALTLVQVCLSALSNRTIDDFNGDSVTGALPVYEGSWNVNGNCSTCYVQLDTSQPFDRTWHDSTQRATEDPYSVTLQFTGTAIYFYGIVPNTAQHGTTKANTKIDVTFTLDGAAVGEYKHTPDTSSTILYSVPMLSSTGLSNKAHTLVVTYTDLLIFDYAMYTWVHFFFVVFR
ncbi:hypothetical protein B0H19DRAFT_957855 [Mycena capillaripes]|nr:hypothetical protein B0H19DRAFT_957855 [Mycena capillaripes]